MPECEYLPVTSPYDDYDGYDDADYIPCHELPHVVSDLRNPGYVGKHRKTA